MQWIGEIGLPPPVKPQPCESLAEVPDIEAIMHEMPCACRRQRKSVLVEAVGDTVDFSIMDGPITDDPLVVGRCATKCGLCGHESTFGACQRMSEWKGAGSALSERT